MHMESEGAKAGLMDEGLAVRATEGKDRLGKAINGQNCREWLTEIVVKHRSPLKAHSTCTRSNVVSHTGKSECEVHKDIPTSA